MRRATAAAARGLVEDTREGESSGIAIPTLNWPPDPSAPFDATARAGKRLSTKEGIYHKISVCVIIVEMK